MGFGVSDRHLTSLRCPADRHLTLYSYTAIQKRSGREAPTRIGFLTRVSRPQKIKEQPMSNLDKRSIKPFRINGRKCRPYVEKKIPFKNSNGQLFGRWETPLMYVVYSYGEHWPLYVWDGFDWFENEDKYSRTTTHHRGYARPYTDNPQIHPRSCSWLKDHIRKHKNYAATPAQTA